MKLSLSVDRFEGDRKDIAVLVAEDGTSVSVPRRLLPEDVEAGDILTITIERDLRATRELVARTKQIQEALKKSDPGGDITL
jgi:hypothetical protein